MGLVEDLKNVKLRHSTTPMIKNSLRTLYEEKYSTISGKKCPLGKRLSNNMYYTLEDLKRRFYRILFQQSYAYAFVILNFTRSLLSRLRLSWVKIYSFV